MELKKLKESKSVMINNVNTREWIRFKLACSLLERKVGGVLSDVLKEFNNKILANNENDPFNNN